MSANTIRVVPRSPSANGWLGWAGRLGFISLVLGAWWLASQTPALRLSLPDPGATAAAMIGQFVAPEFWLDIAQTIYAALVALLISVVGGVTLGLVIGSSRFLLKSTVFVVDFLRSVPGLAVIPLGILVFGPTAGLDIFMVVLAAIWPVLIQSIAAVRNLDVAIKEMAAVYRLPAWRRYLQVLFPACIPGIAAGVRLSAVMALLLAVGTELVAGTPGLGSRILTFQQTAQYPKMYACVALAAFLGIGFNALVLWSEKRSLRWYHIPREMARKTS